MNDMTQKIARKVQPNRGRVDGLVFSWHLDRLSGRNEMDSFVSERFRFDCKHAGVTLDTISCDFSDIQDEFC